MNRRKSEAAIGLLMVALTALGPFALERKNDPADRRHEAKGPSPRPLSYCRS